MMALDMLAKIEGLDEVLDFVRESLEEHGFSMKQQMATEVAVEEIYVNIANYAYHSEDGKVRIEVNMEDSPKRIQMTFIDNGKPYNPLEKVDPDVTLTAEERNIGGLGIFLVKKSMDQVDYVYEDGKNKLTIVKNL